MSGKSSKNLLSCALSRKLSGLVRLSNLETWESPGVSMDYHGLGSMKETHCNWVS